MLKNDCMKKITSPGWGPGATNESYYGVWGNLGSGDKSVTGITYVIWP